MAKRFRLNPEILWKVNPEVISAGFHKSEPRWLSPRRDKVLTDVDIWYVAAGSGAVMVDGRWHAFETGEMVTLMPGQDYQCERSHGDEPFQIYYTHMLPFRGADAHLNAELAKIWPLRLSVGHRPELVRLFDQLYSTYIAGPDPSSPSLRGIAMQILSVAFEEIQRPIISPQPRSYASLLRAKEFMEQVYSSDVSLARIADHADLSKSHLSALFKTHLGLSPIEFLIQVRIREAKRLLADGLAAKEVAQAVGCHSPYYFSRLFRKKTGMSPTQFVRRSRRWNK